MKAIGQLVIILAVLGLANSGVIDVNGVIRFAVRTGVVLLGGEPRSETYQPPFRQAPQLTQQ